LSADVTVQAVIEGFSLGSLRTCCAEVASAPLLASAGV